MRFGFHTGFQHLPKRAHGCKNLRSASLNLDCVTKLIQKELYMGYLYGPFQEIPFEQYRINPIGTAKRK